MHENIGLLTFPRHLLNLRNQRSLALYVTYCASLIMQGNSPGDSLHRHGLCLWEIKVRDDESSQGRQIFLLCTAEEIAALQEGTLGERRCCLAMESGFFLEISIPALLQWLTFAYPRVTLQCSQSEQSSCPASVGKGKVEPAEFILWMVLLCCTNSRQGPQSSSWTFHELFALGKIKDMLSPFLFTNPLCCDPPVLQHSWDWLNVANDYWWENSYFLSNSSWSGPGGFLASYLKFPPVPQPPRLKLCVTCGMSICWLEGVHWVTGGKNLSVLIKSWDREGTCLWGSQSSRGHNSDVWMLFVFIAPDKIWNRYFLL